ncbi:hypothetical protein [Mycoplasma sp. 4044]
MKSSKLNFLKLSKENNTNKTKKHFGSKRLWLILTIVLSVFFLVFSFLPVPVITTIHSYTMGALFGAFSTFIYLFVILFALKSLFKFESKFSWRAFHISINKSIFLVISVVFLTTTLYTMKQSLGEISGKIDAPQNAFKPIFNIWFSQFSKAYNGNTALPNQYTMGIVPTFFYAAFASMGSTVLALVLSIVLLLTSLVLLIVSPTVLNRFAFSKSKREKAKLESLKTTTTKYTQNKATQAQIKTFDDKNEDNLAFLNLQEDKPRVDNNKIVYNQNQRVSYNENIEELSDINNEHQTDELIIQNNEIHQKSIQTQSNIDFDVDPFDTREINIDFDSPSEQQFTENTHENTESHTQRDNDFNNIFYQPSQETDDLSEPEITEISSEDSISNKNLEDIFEDNNIQPFEKEEKASSQKTTKKYSLVDDDDLGLD